MLQYGYYYTEQLSNKKEVYYGSVMKVIDKMREVKMITNNSGVTYHKENIAEVLEALKQFDQDVTLINVDKR